jgi:hypothetical protein
MPAPEPPAGDPITLEFVSPTYDLAKGAKSPSYGVPIPAPFLPHLAQIALLWGAFERMFNEFLLAVVTANKGALKKGWQYKGFHDRKTRFENELRLAFPDQPTTVGYFTTLLSEADDVREKRNVLLHGQVHLSMRAESTPSGPVAVYTIVATGRGRNRQEVNFRFDVDGAELLFYQMAHIAGKLFLLSNPSTLPEQLPLPERSFFLAFLSNNHPAHSSPATPLSPP